LHTVKIRLKDLKKSDKFGTSKILPLLFNNYFFIKSCSKGKQIQKVIVLLRKKLNNNFEDGKV